MATTLTDIISWGGEAPQLISIGTIDDNWRDLLPPGSPTPIVSGVTQYESNFNFVVNAAFAEIVWQLTWSYAVRDSRGAIIQYGSYDFEGNYQQNMIPQQPNVTNITESARVIPVRLTDYIYNPPLIQFFATGLGLDNYNLGFRANTPGYCGLIPVDSTVEISWSINSNFPIISQSIFNNAIRLRGPIYINTQTTDPVDPTKLVIRREVGNFRPDRSEVFDMKSTDLSVYIRDGATVHSYPGQTADQLDATHLFRNRMTAQVTNATTEKYGAQLVLTEPVTPPIFNAAVALRGLGRDIEGPEVLTKSGLSAVTRYSVSDDYRDRTFIYLLQPLRRVTAGWPLPDGTWRVIGSVSAIPNNAEDWKIAILDIGRAVSRVTIMASIWDDPAIAYVHAAPTPDGGAVAVALFNNATVTDQLDKYGDRIVALEKKWLFKRSFDGESWPGDDEAMIIVDLTVEADDDRFAWPVTIFYDGGVLTVADGRNASYVSQQMGAADSWRQLKKPAK